MGKSSPLLAAKGKDETGKPQVIAFLEAEQVSLAISSTYLKGIAPRKQLLILLEWLDTLFCEKHRMAGECLCHAIRRATDVLRKSPGGGLKPEIKTYFSYQCNERKKYLSQMSTTEAQIIGTVSWIDNKFRVYIPIPVKINTQVWMHVLAQTGKFDYCRFCPLAVLTKN